MQKQASVALSDACLPGDQEIEGLISAESNNILSRRLIMKYLNGHSLPFANSRMAVTVSKKRMCKTTG